MKAVILAGGFGTRISEESAVKPKPMVEIGNKPILWHIMKIYSTYGINDFIICCGYKGESIKEYFANYYLHKSDVTFDMKNNSMLVHGNNVEPWTVTLVDTGLKTMTGGRLKRVAEYVDNQTFCMTYGDGVSNINIKQLIDFHKSNNVLATLTSVQPPCRFAAFTLSDSQNLITSFTEKPHGDRACINGVFFVLEPEVFRYIDGDATVFEKKPLEIMAEKNQLCAFRHHGFWQPMDTLRDKNYLEELWSTESPPWKIW